MTDRSDSVGLGQLANHLLNVHPQLLGDWLLQHVSIHRYLQLAVYVALYPQTAPTSAILFPLLLLLFLSLLLLVLILSLLSLLHLLLPLFDYSDSCQVDPSSAVVGHLVPVSLYGKDSTVHHRLSSLLKHLTLLSNVKLVLVDDQNFLVLSLEYLYSCFSGR